MFEKIIKKIESVIKVDLKFYAKNGFYLVLASGITIGTSLLLPLFYTSYLTPTEYGKYVFILSFLSTLALFTLPGMKTAISEALAKDINSFYPIGVKTRRKWSILAFFAMIGISIYFVFDDPILSVGFLIASCYLPLVHFDAYSDYYVAKKKFKRLSINSTLFGLFQFSLTALVLFLFQNFYLAIFTYFYSTILYLFILYMYENRNITQLESVKEFDGVKESDLIKESLHYGKYLTFLQMFQVIRNELAIILIGVFLSYEVLGIYAIALIIPNLYKGSFSVMNTLFFPGLAELPDKEAYKNYKKRFLIGILIFVGFCVLIILAIPFIINFLYPPMYSASIMIAIVLMISFILGLPTSFNNLYYTSQKRLHEIKMLTYIGIPLEIVLLCILIPIFGIWGVLITRLIYQSFNGILSTILLRRIKF